MGEWMPTEGGNQGVVKFNPPRQRSIYYWCHECKNWQPSAKREDNTYHCTRCWETILCDECGYPWMDDHECGSRD